MNFKVKVKKFLENFSHSLMINNLGKIKKMSNHNFVNNYSTIATNHHQSPSVTIRRLVATDGVTGGDWWRLVANDSNDFFKLRQFIDSTFN